MKVHDTEVSVACRHLFRRYQARHFPPCLKSFGHDPTILRSELSCCPFEKPSRNKPRPKRITITEPHHIILSPLLALLQKPSHYALHHPRRMRLREMGIAPHHLQRLVPQHLGNLQQARPAHRQIARGGVAQIVKPKILQLRLGPRLLPGGADVQRFCPVLPGVHLGFERDHTCTIIHTGIQASHPTSAGTVCDRSRNSPSSIRRRQRLWPR